MMEALSIALKDQNYMAKLNVINIFYLEIVIHSPHGFLISCSDSITISFILYGCMLKV